MVMLHLGGMLLVILGVINTALKQTVSSIYVC